MWPAGDAGQSRESSKPVHVLWGPWQPHGSPSGSCPSSFTSMTHAYYQAYISNTTPPLPGFCDLLYRKQINRDTQSGILCCISSVMCGQPVSHSSLGEKKKGNRVTDRAPFCVIQDGFNCVWAVSSSASLRERDARLLLCCHRDDLPGRRLTYIWDTNQLPCLRSWRHKLKALFRKRRIKQRENVSLCVCVRLRGRMRRQSRKQRTLR